MLKENYKQKREELNDLLIEMDIPKHLYFVLVELNLYIYQNKRFHPDAQKALDLIHEISYEKLTYFNLRMIPEEI